MEIKTDDFAPKPIELLLSNDSIQTWIDEANKSIDTLQGQMSADPNKHWLKGSISNRKVLVLQMLAGEIGAFERFAHIAHDNAGPEEYTSEKSENSFEDKLARSISLIQDQINSRLHHETESGINSRSEAEAALEEMMVMVDGSVTNLDEWRTFADKEIARIEQHLQRLYGSTDLPSEWDNRGNNYRSITTISPDALQRIRNWGREGNTEVEPALDELSQLLENRKRRVEMENSILIRNTKFESMSALIKQQLYVDDQSKRDIILSQKAMWLKKVITGEISKEEYQSKIYIDPAIFIGGIEDFIYLIEEGSTDLEVYGLLMNALYEQTIRDITSYSELLDTAPPGYTDPANFRSKLADAQNLNETLLELINRAKTGDRKAYGDFIKYFAANLRPLYQAMNGSQAGVNQSILDLNKEKMKILSPENIAALVSRFNE